MDECGEGGVGLQWMSVEREGGPPVDEWGGGGGLYVYKGSVWRSHMVILLFPEQDSASSHCMYYISLCSHIC